MSSLKFFVIFAVLSALGSGCTKEVPLSPLVTDAQIETPPFLRGMWVSSGMTYEITEHELCCRTSGGLFSKGKEYRYQLELDLAMANDNLYVFEQSTEGNVYKLRYASKVHDKDITLVVDGNSMVEYRIDDRTTYTGTFYYTRK